MKQTPHNGCCWQGLQMDADPGDKPCISRSISRFELQKETEDTTGSGHGGAWKSMGAAGGFS